MTRKWHVEHADGSEWTIDDLERWALGHPEENMIYCDMASFMTDEYGGLLVADECGSYCYVGQSPDMAVVWDEQRDPPRAGEVRGRAGMTTGDGMAEARERRVGFANTGDPMLCRKGLTLESLELEGRNDRGDDIFAVTVSNDTCEVTIHRVTRDHLDQLTHGTFDMGLWRCADE